jgi:ATP-dependent protease HslVU (ClpYQ) peptidase subunit
MTTVLGIRQGKKVILVSDSQATGGNHTYDVQKIHQIGGYTFAAAGALKAAQDTVRALQKEAKSKKKKKHKPSINRFVQKASFPSGHGAEYLVALKGHLYEVGHDGSIVEHEDGVPASLGTGGDFAVGAIAAGASATEAVQIAMAFDAYSGGDIVELVVK